LVSRPISFSLVSLLFPVKTRIARNSRRPLSLLVPTPPHYRRTVAVHDCFCRMCIHYEEGWCAEHHVPVDHNFTCDDWKRNWKAPEY